MYTIDQWYILISMLERERAGEREVAREGVREREREIHRQTERERQRQREGDRQKDRETQTDRDGERETERETDRQRDTNRQRQTDRQTDRQREGDRQTDRERETHKQTERERERERETDRQTDPSQSRGSMLTSSSSTQTNKRGIDPDTLLHMKELLINLQPLSARVRAPAAPRLKPPDQSERSSSTQCNHLPIASLINNSIIDNNVIPHVVVFVLSWGFLSAMQTTSGRVCSGGL